MKKGYLYLLITFFFWGSLYVVNKTALQSLPPVTLLLARHSIAVFLLGALAFRRGMKHIQAAHWPYFFFFGAGGYFLSTGLQNMATNLMPSSVAALANSVNPVFMSLFAVMLLHEKFTKNKGLGIVLSLAGVYMVLGLSGNMVSAEGVAYSLVSVILWSFNAVMIRKISSVYPGEQITFISTLIAVPFCMAASYAELQTHAVHMNGEAAAAVLYLAVLCTALTNLLWSKSLQLLDASVCSMFYPLQILFASLLGVIFLGEPMTLNFIAGGLLIAAGVIVSLYVPRSKKDVHFNRLLPLRRILRLTRSLGINFR